MTDLEQAFVEAGYSAEEAAEAEAAIEAACHMLGTSEAMCGELRTAAGLLAATGTLDADIVEVFGRVVPISRAMLHRHYGTDEEGLDAKLAAGPVPVSHGLVLGW